MKYVREEMPLNKNLYNKLNNICTFSNLKLKVICGIVFKVSDTNVSFIEPHRFVIIINDVKLILLCYDFHLVISKRLYQNRYEFIGRF